MSQKNMSEDQFSQIMNRLDKVDTRLDQIEDHMVRKSDVFQSVLTVQAFTAAVIVGVVVTLNAMGMFA